MAKDAKRQVFLENWQEQLEATILNYGDGVAWMSDGLEKVALSNDLVALEEMRRQVREVAPTQRQTYSSLVIRLSVEQPLAIPQDLICRIGELFEIYRRFRSQLVWRTGLDD
jgi:hypothetical protein